jgi:cell division protein ZapD
MDNLLCYEYPLSEHFRLFLRLEANFAQVEHYLQQCGYWSSRTTVNALCDLLTLLDRPELKTKLLQQLSHYKKIYPTHLTEMQDKFPNRLSQIESSINYLQNSVGKLTQELDKVEFLTNVRLRLTQTGGGWNFDLPMYHFWLHQSTDRQSTDLKKWYDQLLSVREIIDLLLSISRDSSQFIDVTAKEGFYEQALDQNVDYQLLRFNVAQNLKVFPDFSIGRHRFSLHFFTLTANEKMQPSTNTVHFKLSCCL